MTEQALFNYLVAAGFTRYGAAGLIGNLIAESGLRANNLQNGFERALGMDDATYTAAVDFGAYDNFVHDGAGYGLAQWTYYTRKAELLKFAKARGVSIADYQMQVDFMLQELRGYAGVWETLRTAQDVRTASDAVLLQYERPADQSEGVQVSRSMLGEGVLARCSGTATPEPKAAAGARQFSPLATAFVDFGSSLSNPRKDPVSVITPHHAATVTTDPVAIAKYHRNNPGREASANYYIAGGKICGGVVEGRRAWTSGTGNGQGTNDHKAITIEVANSTGKPDWKISDADYNALVKLCAELCTYYNIEPHFDGTKNGTITMHKQFQNTACPGPYLEPIIRSGKFENDIRQAMGGVTPTPTPEPVVLYRVQTGAFRIRINAEKQLAKIRALGIDGLLVQDNGLYKVQVGAFANRDNALGMVAKMQRCGYRDAFITTRQGQVIMA